MNRDVERREGRVDVWRIGLSVAASDPPSPFDLPKLLDAEQRSRAEQLATPLLKRRFTQCQVALRLLISRYLTMEPAAIEFRTGPHGKPSVNLPADRPFHFNLSHSGSIALIGIRLDAPLGIDIESIRENVDLWSVARQVFTDREQQRLRQVRASELSAQWFQLWTVKEAILKAVGTGMLMDPRMVETAPDLASARIDPASLIGECVIEVTPLAPANRTVAAVASPEPFRIGRDEWFTPPP